jgi:hypothetical protein
MASDDEKKDPFACFEDDDDDYSITNNVELKVFYFRRVFCLKALRIQC